MTQVKRSPLARYGIPVLLVSLAAAAAFATVFAPGASARARRSCPGDGTPTPGSTINGGLEVIGGAGPFGGPFGVTFNAIEDNVIHGGATISGYTGFWQGFFRNSVSGSVNFNNNTLVDPDGNEVQTNTIDGNLNCSGNDPAPQAGDSGGSPNNVTGQKTGQCTTV